MHSVFLRSFALMAVALALFAGPSVAADAIYTGTFKGAGGKKSSGNFEIFKKGGKTFITLKSNFRLSSVPDPKLAFGNGKYKKGHDLHRQVEKSERRANLRDSRPPRSGKVFAGLDLVREVQRSSRGRRNQEKVTGVGRVGYP